MKELDTHRMQQGTCKALGGHQRHALPMPPPVPTKSPPASTEPVTPTGTPASVNQQIKPGGS